MNPRVVIYTRVSTQEQVENLSLPTQEKECRKYCEKNQYDVDEVFRDKGESAKTINRPDFLKMLEHCRKNKGKISYVIVYQLSRFSRNQEDHVTIRALLLKYGIKLKSVLEQIDDSPVGKLMENILATLNQFDNDMKRDRTITGMSEAIETGYWPFPVPLGYLRKRNGTSRSKVILDKKRAPLVRKAFEIYSTGNKTEQEVLRQITAMGLRTLKNKTLSHQAFNQMLRNALYAGIMEVKSWKKHKKATFKAIVSEPIFYRVQQILNGSPVMGKMHKKHRPEFPLRHFAKCQKCGRPLTASFSKGRKARYPYYRCPTVACKINVKKEALESIFVEFLKQLTPDAENFRLLKRIILDVWKKKKADAFEMSKSVEQLVKELQARRQNLIDAFLYRKVIEKDVYDEQLAILDEQIALTKMENHQAERNETDMQGALNYAEFVLADPSGFWKELSDEPRRKLQAVLFPQGVHFSGTSFGTAQTPILFKLLEKNPSENTRVVPRTGIEPVSQASEARILSVELSGL